MGTLNSWDVVDAGNNDAPPDGWPENTMNYSEVNDTGRAVQGTVKRWFSDNNGTLDAGGVADAYELTLNETGYTSYFDGMTFRCSIPAQNTTTTPTIDVNGIGPQLITDNEGLPISVGNFLSGGIYDFQYDGTNFRVGGGALGSSSAAGSDTELQFNDNGLLGGIDEWTYDSGTGQVTVTTSTTTPAAVFTSTQFNTEALVVSSPDDNRVGPLMLIELTGTVGNGVGLEIVQDQPQWHLELDGAAGYGIRMDGGILFQERADHANIPGAGFGELWVRDDSGPNGNKLFYTDDEGNDFDLTSLNGGNQPTGTIIAWPAETPPAGFLVCDGSTVLVDDYPDLFAVIGYTYGGSGAAFDLPDYRGEFLRGWADGSLNDPDRNSRTNRGDGTTGDNVGTKQGSQNLIHDHLTDEGSGHRHTDIGRRRGDSDGNDTPSSTTWDSSHFTGFSTTGLTVEFSGGSEARPRNVYVNYCIRFASTGTAGNAAGLNGSVQYNQGNDFAGDNLLTWNAVDTLTLENNLVIRAPENGDPTSGSDNISSYLRFQSNDGNDFGAVRFDGGDALEIYNFAVDADITLLATNNLGDTEFGITFNANAFQLNLDVNNNNETIFDVDTSGALGLEDTTVNFFGPVVLANDAGELVFEEKNDHSSTVQAARGYLWVRDDTPNVLVFTDDEGNDTVLGAGGGGGGSAAVIGSIVPWPSDTPPAGWFECDGQELDRVVYADLFAVIGTTYGDGDGVNTFNLPDLRGEFLRGFDNGAGNDPDAGSRTDRGDGTTGDNVGTKQADEFGSHNHSFEYQQLDETGTNNPVSNIQGTGNTEFTTSEGGSETRPRNVYMMFIINAEDQPTLPDEVANHRRAGNEQLWEGIAGILTPYDVQANVTENTFETFGPTGSGAQNIWTDLDQLPDSARAVCVQLEVNMLQDTNNVAVSFSAWALDGDSTETAANEDNNVIFDQFEADGANRSFNFVRNVWIPINANRVFQFRWNQSGGPTPGVDMKYKGFRTDTALSMSGGGGGGDISGSIAANEIAFGSGPDTIQGVPDFTYTDGVGTGTIDFGGNTATLTSNGQIIIDGDGSTAVSLRDGGVTKFSIAGTGSRLQAEVPLFFQEQASALPDVAGLGQLWVRNDTPNVLVFTDDAGTDFVLNGGGGGGTIGGSISDNRVAVGAATADEIEGTDDLTYTDSLRRLAVGTALENQSGEIYIGRPTSTTRGLEIRHSGSSAGADIINFVGSIDYDVRAATGVHNFIIDSSVIFSVDDSLIRAFENFQFSGAIYEDVDPVPASDINLDNATFHTKTITANTTFTFSNPPAAGLLGQFTLKLTNGGAFTITWPASVVWPGGTEPSWSAAGVDIVSFFTDDGGTTYYGLLGGLDFQ